MNNFTGEFSQATDLIIDKIISREFTKGWKGYDIEKVDTLLDDLFQIANEHKNNGDAQELIDLSCIDRAEFERGYTGYDADQVDKLLGEIKESFIMMNQIKVKYRD